VSLSQELQLIAGEIGLCAPEQAARLRACAVKVRRIEVALDEIVDDAMESARLAEQIALEGVVVKFPGRLG
jgi:hypothetical protein